MLSEDLANAAGFFDREHKIFAILLASHCATADGSWPDWSHE